ncbi:conjugative transfer relaxase/helicase TraI domain-containing protein [Escherichia coli]
MGSGGHECRAAVQYGAGVAGRGGRPCRSSSGGTCRGDSLARFIAPGRKYPQPYVAQPAFDRNGKSAGIWLNPLTTDDGNGLRGCAVRGPAGQP